MKKLIGTLLASLYLVACGLSPQVVKIDPILSDIKGIPATNAPNLALIITDARNNPVLGKRGGVYKETSTIITEGDITEKIYHRVVTAFSKANYVIDPSAKTQLNITITKLSYEGYGINRINEVEVRAEIHAIVTREEGTLTRTFKESRNNKVLMAPDERKNEELINEILGSVIQRVLDDEKLLDYIVKTP